MRTSSLLFNQGIPQDNSHATLVSIVPFPINESKPGLTPGEFNIDACLDGRPVCKVIGDAFFYVYIDADRGNLRVPAPSGSLANSICFDYNTAQLEASDECHPGLFWLPGALTTEEVEKKHEDQLDYMRAVQHNWFVELVKRADDDWEKTRQHYSISDIQRYALRSIDPSNSKNRPWILVVDQPEAIEHVASQICPACGSDIPENVAICRYCSFVVDQNRFSAMTFASKKAEGFDLKSLASR